RNISLFKPGAILINTARGAVIESYDILISALESQQLRQVAMDTLIVEPPDLSHPFFQHRNVILTAHVAARTQRAQEAILRTMGHDLEATLGGDLPPRENLANPEVFPEDH
ncbi:MAG: NAD(P)-dependent oxidoreductase, partial [Planctomycetota bacterium]|nr:NAD(P)-dependent oxidoreductase [Planctomycetota bacterium]